MPITWGELKEKMKDAGISDSQIIYIVDKYGQKIYDAAIGMTLPIKVKGED